MGFNCIDLTSYLYTVNPIYYCTFKDPFNKCGELNGIPNLIPCYINEMDFNKIEFNKISCNHTVLQGV